MKYSETTIAFTPPSPVKTGGFTAKTQSATGQVKVGPWVDPVYECGRTWWGMDYYGTMTSCGYDVHDPQAILYFIFNAFHILVVKEKIDPQVVHEAFKEIDEYRERPDIPDRDPPARQCLPWTHDEMPKDEYLLWVAGRKAAAELIDVETCEIGCWMADGAYPYFDTRPEAEKWRHAEHDKFNFVRSPESDGWICESDLPIPKWQALDARIERESEARDRDPEAKAANERAFLAGFPDGKPD